MRRSRVGRADVSPKQATRLIASAFVVAIVLIAWRHVRDGSAPPPSAFTYPTAIFGGAALIADVGAPGLGAVLALALSVGIGFGLFERGAVGAGRAAAGAAAPTAPDRPRDVRTGSRRSSRAAPPASRRTRRIRARRR